MAADRKLKRLKKSYNKLHSDLHDVISRCHLGRTDTTRDMMGATSLQCDRRLQAFRLLSLSLLALLVTTSAEDPSDSGDRMDDERALSKPWYSRKIVISDKELPFSPVSVVGFILILINVVRIFTDSSFAVASHILLTDDDAKTKLSKLKAEIGDDAAMFAKAAKDMSKCPSSRQGGNLGRFKRGEMAPPFDRAVFDPSNKLNSPVGPIQTSFGWHLIYIHERKV